MSNEPKPFTVTMIATHFVYADSATEAEDIVSEALLKLDLVDPRIADTETHWAQAETIEGHHSTIVRDGDALSDYDKYLLEQDLDKK